MMKTPYYIIHKDILDSLNDELNSAIKKFWPNTIVAYSFKTNSNSWLIQYLKKKNIYAEVVSNDEYELSQLFNYKNKVVYNGIAKDKASFINAIKNRCIVNIDSWKEIEWLSLLSKKQLFNIGIRINFDLEAFCPGQSQGGKDGSRFGFCYENGELLKAINLIKRNKNINISGIHLHCSSKTRSLDIYKTIANMACKIKKEYSLDLDYIDIGGGFFGGMKGKPTYKDYFREVSNIISVDFDSKKTKLIVEPGMSLIGPSISYVSSVVDIKKTRDSVFVVTDGSRIHIDPLMRKSSYFFDIVYNKNSKKKIAKQTIVGFTCMENDRIFDLSNNVELKVEDKIVYNKVGAYTMCLAPLFIKYFPKVYVENNNKLILVNNNWTAKTVSKVGN